MTSRRHRLPTRPGKMRRSPDSGARSVTTFSAVVFRCGVFAAGGLSARAIALAQSVSGTLVTLTSGSTAVSGEMAASARAAPALRAIGALYGPTCGLANVPLAYSGVRSVKNTACLQGLGCAFQDKLAGWVTALMGQTSTASFKWQTQHNRVASSGLLIGQHCAGIEVESNAMVLLVTVKIRHSQMINPNQGKS